MDDFLLVGYEEYFNYRRGWLYRFSFGPVHGL